MQIANLIMALPGAAAQGLIWGIMAIGVYLTFRVLDIADLTVDGTMCTGGAVCVMMMTSGHNVWVSLLVATLAGMTAGLVTGIFHTFMGIPAILAGILTQLSLYSVNLKIMGKANQAINVCKSLILCKQGAGKSNKSVGNHKSKYFAKISVDTLCTGHVWIASGSTEGTSKLCSEKPVKNCDDHNNK